jgi:hypothetical protein
MNHRTESIDCWIYWLIRHGINQDTPINTPIKFPAGCETKEILKNYCGCIMATGGGEGGINKLLHPLEISPRQKRLFQHQKNKRISQKLHPPAQQKKCRFDFQNNQTVWQVAAYKKTKHEKRIPFPNGRQGGG